MRSHGKISMLTMFFMVCFLTVCAFGFVGRTNAYYTGTSSKENQINVQKVQIEVEEEVEGLTKKSITIENPDSASCYVRMKVSVPNIKGLITTGPNIGSDFQDGGDGFYYLTYILQPGNKVTLGGTPAFYEARFADNLTDAEKARIASLADVVIYVEAVQSDGIDVGEKQGAEAAKAAFAKVAADKS